MSVQHRPDSATFFLERLQGAHFPLTLSIDGDTRLLIDEPASFRKLLAFAEWMARMEAVRASVGEKGADPCRTSILGEPC